MLKKSDLYSVLTQDQSPVWKGSWPETINNLYSTSGFTSENLIIFLSNDSLKRHLQLLSGEEKLNTIKRLFYVCESKAIGIYSNQSDPNSLELLLKLVDLQKLYDEIVIKDKVKEYVYPLLFGNSLSNIQDTKTLINRLGYDTLSVLAEKINFDPSLIMQIARGLDKDETIDTTGREKLVNVLKEKYNDILPVYDWLSSEEETRNNFGVFSEDRGNIIAIDEEGKDVNIFYNESPYQIFFPKSMVLKGIAKNMEPDEYANFIFSLINTNTTDKKTVKFPYHTEENLPEDFALAIFKKLIDIDKRFDKSLIDVFLDNIYKPEIKELFEKYPIDSFYDVNSYSKIYSEISKDEESQYCVVLYQLLRAILTSKINEDYTLFIKDYMDNDFNWINLENNPAIAINGFGSEEQLFNFFSKNPELAEKCAVDFKGKQEIINDFLKKSEEEVMEEQDIYKEAIDSNIVYIYETLPDSVMDFLIEEGKKLGISKTESVKYLTNIILYEVQRSYWGNLCKKMHKKDKKFLGIDLSKTEAVFLPVCMTHYGYINPVIIKNADFGFNNTPIDKLFENLGISSYLAKEGLNLAHEGAHALHYLADPQWVGKEGYDPSDPSSDIDKYLGNVLESVAYAHGTLPYFKKLIMENISKVLSSPIFQKAILSWIISNILSSEDASLQGIYNSKEIMRVRNNIEIYSFHC